MAKQLETSIDAFSRREPAGPLLILSAVVFVSLAVVLVMSLAAGNWLIAVLVAVVLVAAVAFAVRNYIAYRRLAAGADGKRIDWQTAQPEVQRQTLNLEVFELSKILDVESTQITDLQSAYIVAEDLALRQLQHDENVPLMRHVTIGKTPFDAVMLKSDVVNCVDVSFLVVPDIRQEKIDAMLKKIGMVKRTFADMGMRFRVRLMMVLVTQLTLEDTDRLRNILSKQRFEETPVDIDIRMLDFESLQKLYVTD